MNTFLIASLDILDMTVLLKKVFYPKNLFFKIDILFIAKTGTKESSEMHLYTAVIPALGASLLHTLRV